MVVSFILFILLFLLVYFFYFLLQMNDIDKDIITITIKDAATIPIILVVDNVLAYFILSSELYELMHYN